VTDEALLRWAGEFIEVLARGQHTDLHSLEESPFEQHVALAQVVPEKLPERRAPRQRAAVWAEGGLGTLSDGTKTGANCVLPSSRGAAPTLVSGAPAFFPRLTVVDGSWRNAASACGAPVGSSRRVCTAQELA